MARIVILGGGFAGVSAAEILAAEAGAGHQITLISATPEFTFYPALVPMVFGDFDARDIRFDMRPKLAELGIRFIEGEVLAIEPERRSVRVAGDDIDGNIQFDYLVVATGRRLATERVPGFFEHAHHLLGIGAALKLKNAISEFATGSIVVGLCPDANLPVPVCEAAFALARKFEPEIAAGTVSVTAVFPSTLEKAFAGSSLFRDIDEEFDRLGVRLVPDFAIERIEERRIVSLLGPSLDYELLMLVPPFRGQNSLRHLSPITDDAGFAEVNDLLQVKGFERIYAAGDVLALPGPKFGYMAMRQGKTVARNIIAQLRNEEPAAEYSHRIAWALSEKYTDPVFFHYGFWDETLDDFDENAIFGMARQIRKLYGPIKSNGGTKSAARF